jgi:hypothetical protein
MKRRREAPARCHYYGMPRSAAQDRNAAQCSATLRGGATGPWLLACTQKHARGSPVDSRRHEALVRCDDPRASGSTELEIDKPELDMLTAVPRIGP